MSGPDAGAVRLIGGEMAAWSDTAPGRRAPAGGPLLRHLVSRLPAPGRTLLAGPHDPGLVTAVRGTRVTCLLRSMPDATALARSGVEVLCGTLPKLDADGAFDLVIALDGVDRLCSVEGPQLDWTESLRALRATLRPGGTLLVAVANEVGIHRLVECSPATSAQTEADWNPIGEFDAGRPGNPDRLAARLAAEGLAVTWLGAGWPTPEAPTLVAGADVLGDPGGPVGALEAAAAAAAAAAYRGRPVLSDPRRLAAAAVRAGLGAEFAATWFVLAHRDTGTLTMAPFPPVLMGDADLGSVMELDRDHDGRWVRRCGSEPNSVAGPVPGGRLLEELLVSACVRHDLPAARRLLTGYATWLVTLDDGHAVATFDNVLVDTGGFAVLDPSRRIDPPAPAGVAAVRALRRFATTLVTGGYAHPWAIARDVDALTDVLAAAAGIEVDSDRHAAAIDLEVEVRAAARPGVDRSALLDEVRRPGVAPPVMAPDGWREREDLTRRLSADLADAQARAAWSEAELVRREAELRRARMQIATFSGRPVYRLVRATALAGRRVWRRMRRSLRAVRR